MDNKLTMREMPLDSTPYEKFKINGADNLSLSELFAIIIRNGTKKLTALEIAERLLLKYDIKKLSNATYTELMQEEGIGEVKAIEIKSIFEIAKRIEKSLKNENVILKDPKTIADYARCSCRLKNYEVLKVLYLNNALGLIEEEDISDFQEFVSIPIKRILKNAILNNATKVVLVHNHPSGDVRPSSDDRKATKKLYESLKCVGVALVDHIIISDSDYMSFRNNNFFEFE